MTLNRTQAVKIIYDAIKEYGYSLPTAVHIYDYLNGFGAIPVTKDDIARHLLTSYNIEGVIK